MADDAYELEAGVLLSQLMFGWILDGIHGNTSPVFTLTADEYVEKMSALADLGPGSKAD